MTLAVVSGGDGLPPEPDWSQIYSDAFDLEVAHQEWGQVTRELQSAGTLAVTNGHAIKRLVEFRIQYERAAREVAEHGPVLKAKRSRVPQYNPQWIVMRQCDESIRVLEAELGIAPVRRGRATKVEKKARAARASDSYLTPVTKR